jgi:hypothetical protein
MLVYLKVIFPTAENANYVQKIKFPSFRARISYSSSALMDVWPCSPISVADTPTIVQGIKLHNRELLQKKKDRIFIPICVLSTQKAYSLKNIVFANTTQ